MHKLFTIAFCIISFGLFSQEMRIGLLRSLKSKKATVSYGKGIYEVYGDSVRIGEIAEGKSFFLSLNSNKVSCTLDGVSGSYDTIMITPLNGDSYFSLRSSSPTSKSHSYEGSLEVSAGKSRLSLINVVSMNDYLSGVIESEGGGGRHVEYYKVQALMSRTYAYQNQNRHKEEGFSLCDNVHCQAYHNRLKRTERIRTAVEETDGEVIVGPNGKMLTTYFHANCGGETSDASYVWNNSIPYCSPFIDTFCIHTRQATWTKWVERSSWEQYIQKEYGINLNSDGLELLAYEFVQDQRKAFYIHPSLGIPLRDLRSKFKLKSTFFDVHLEQGKVRIDGRGFGHGIGLCQEGAMNMANLGYSYRQIATFYFNGVSLLNYERKLFFDQTGEM